MREEAEVDVDDRNSDVDPLHFVRIYRGPLLRRPRIDIQQAVNEAIHGGVVYGARHPIFVIYPMLAVVPAVVGVLLSLTGALEESFFWPCMVVIVLAGLMQAYLIVSFRRHFIAISGNRVKVCSGVFKPKRPSYYISDMPETDPTPPPLGLGWLRYSSWDPTTPGEYSRKSIRHIWWMEELAAVMSEIKVRFSTQSTDVVAALLEDLNKKQHTTNVLLEGVQVSLEEIGELLRGGIKVTGSSGLSPEAADGLASSMRQLTRAIEVASAPPPEPPPALPPEPTRPPTDG